MYIDSVALRTVFSKTFREWFQRLEEADESLARILAADLAYLAEHGRAAALPTVRHRIQASRHFPNLAEVRTQHTDGAGPVVRVLVMFHGDDAIVVLIGGDKSRLGNAWYDQAIPIADQLYDRFMEATQ